MIIFEDDFNKESAGSQSSMLGSLNSFHSLLIQKGSLDEFK